MFVRVKAIGKYRYLQLVKNRREGRRTVQDVLCTLGRLEELEANGVVDRLLRSLGRFGQRVGLVEADQRRCSQPDSTSTFVRYSRSETGLQHSRGTVSCPAPERPPARRLRGLSGLNQATGPPLSLRDARAGILGKSEIFSGLDMNHLVELSRVAVERTLRAGEFLFLEDDPVESCYLVTSGLVKILKHSSSGTDRIISIRGPGEMLGNMALFLSKPHSFSAQAITHTRVLTVESSDFVAFIYRDPGSGLEIFRRMLNVASQRQQAAAVRLSELAANRTDYRLASVLFALCSEFGVTIPLTRREIAEMAGTTAETTARFVSRLQRRRVVESFRGKIVVLDREKLLPLERLHLAPYVP